MNTNKKAPTDKQPHKSSDQGVNRGSDRPWRRRVAQAATLVILSATTACAPQINTRGNAVNMEDVAAIEPNVFTRDLVLNKLGSPSSSTSFGDDVWYYISERTETTAFFAPQLIDRQVVAVKFNQYGVVTSVDLVDETRAEQVKPVDRVTPTSGSSSGIIDQFLGNLGRFNK